MLRVAVLFLLLVGTSGLALSTHALKRNDKASREDVFRFMSPRAAHVPGPSIPSHGPQHESKKFLVTSAKKGETSQGSAEKHLAQDSLNSESPAIPTSTKCIVIVCIQYMVVYLALAVCRTYHEFSGTGKGDLEAGLKSAAQTLTYGPMLCVLFIACRMHVEYLSEGHGQPQMWVQNAMYFVTFAVMASMCLTLAIPLITGKTVPLKEGDDYLKTPGICESTGGDVVAFKALTFTRYLVLMGIHGGVISIIVGTRNYLPPGEIDHVNVPQPGNAVGCTMILAVVFFLAQLVIAICRTCEEAKFSFLEFPRIVGVMNAAACTVEFAPMLAILFLSARMQALQHNSQPQAWAQSLMFIGTGSMCVTTLLAILVPLLMGASMEVNPQTREVKFSLPSPTLGYVFMGMRCLCMVGFYSGALGVICSIFSFQAPGDEPTLPVAPAVHCVVILTCQFFFVYAMMTVMLTVSELSGGKFPLESYGIYAGLDAAKATVSFAPMLAILFVTTRMYALLLSDNKGAPPSWVQDGMYMATWSLMISFLACLCTSLFMDKVDTDDDGNVVNKFSNKVLATVMTVLRYLLMVLLYGGIVLVIAGIFTMTPEAALANGSPLLKAPPGPRTAVGTMLSFVQVMAQPGRAMGGAMHHGVRSLTT